jgi:hypothetical protein
MKKYQEVKHTLGNNVETGEAEWQKPEILREVSLKEEHAEDLNAQFVTTGIKYELVEEIEGEEEEIKGNIVQGEQKQAPAPTDNGTQSGKSNNDEKLVSEAEVNNIDNQTTTDNGTQSGTN